MKKRRTGHGTGPQVPDRTNRNRTIQAHSTAAQDRARTWQAAGEHGLSVQFARKNPRKYSFAVEKWNKLPEDVKTSRNGEEFKNKLKKL
jgi:hypothetical protein